VLDWLDKHPQDVLFTNGVSHLNGIFPYVPNDTLHVAVQHDVGGRYRADLLSYARYLDGVVSVSDYIDGWMRKDLRAIGFSGLVRRIHNGTSYPPAPCRVASAGPLKLLFVGNLWLKGGAQLIDLAKALRRRGVDFHLTVIGDDAAQPERQFARAGMGERLTWICRQRRDDLWRIYASQDLLLMLSWGEPFGMVTIEAMGMGCVPVAYDVPSGSREIIENGISGFLLRSNPHEIAAVLADLAPDRLLKMSAETARRARAHFSAARAARQYVELIDDLMCCKDLIRRSRLPADGHRLAVKPPRRSPLARLYYGLPSSWRHRIRVGLAAYPTGTRWLRERF